MKWFVGRNVKKAFPALDPDGNKTFEHMWVFIEKVHGNALVGKLNSAPIFTTEVGFGDEVRVKRSEIEDVFTSHRDN